MLLKRYLICLVCIALLWGCLFPVLLNTVFKETREVEITETVKTKKKTYVCYVTVTGECYHSEKCHYVNKNAKKTNVYQAEKNGYRGCSNCTPEEKIKVIVDKEITKYVEKEFREPFFSVLICACFSVLLCIVLLTKPLILFVKNRKKKQKKNVKKITVEFIKD